MTLLAAIEPSQDLELYLGYSRPAGQYADYADIRHRLTGVAPGFDFDRAMTSPDDQIISVRDETRVRAMAVLARSENHRIFRLYYADDAVCTRTLMSFVDGVLNAQPPSNV